MNILWFVNVALPEVCERLGLPICHQAGWLEGYIGALRMEANISLTVVTRSAAAVGEGTTCVGNVRYIVMRQAGVDTTAALTRDAIEEYKAVVEAVKPDLVHFHGSEFHYGLLKADGHIQMPGVLSIQGLMAECARVYCGGLSWREQVRAHTLGEVVYRSGIWSDRRKFVRRSIVERKVIGGMGHVIGRTRWDRAHVREIDPQVKYYHCEEIIRPAFFRSLRSGNAYERYTIFTVSGAYPLKGLHVLLKAVSLLRGEFREIRVRVAGIEGVSAYVGSGYCRFLQELASDLGVSDCIEWLGLVDASGVVGALVKAHIFVVPSLIENRSNSLAEAMLVGVPCIASLAGGMTCTVKDGRTALCFPPGDYAMLAECIRLLFLNDELAKRLAKNAREVASKRHDQVAIGRRMVDIYEAVCRGNEGEVALGEDETLARVGV